MGQDSDGEDIEGSTKVQVVREESVQPDSIEEPGPKGTTSSDSLAMEQLQRLFDPTPAPSSAADKISDKPAATLPRNLPRQQVGLMICVLRGYYLCFRVVLPADE